MNEKFPRNNLENRENTENTLRQEKISLAHELAESRESFPFPGINPDSYEGMKAAEEEFPGYSIPIDELMKRFQDEGIKVVLGKNPDSGNVFILPQGSDDIENDSIFPRQLLTTEDMDERLSNLSLKDS